jgi:hypothetical protein
MDTAEQMRNTTMAASMMRSKTCPGECSATVSG